MAKNTYDVPLKLKINFNQLKSQKLAMLAWVGQLRKTNEPHKVRLLNQLIDMFQEIQDQAVYEQNVPFDMAFASDEYEERWEKESGWIKK